MAPATCNPEPRPPRSDSSRAWIAIGSEAAGTVAASALLGWWLRKSLGSEMILVACCLLGVGAAVWRLIRAAR